MEKSKSKSIVEPIAYIILYLAIFFACWIGSDKLFSWIYSILPDKTAEQILYKCGFWVVFKFAIPILLIMLVFKIRRINFFEFCKFKKITKKDTGKILFISLLGAIFTIHFSNTSFALKNIPEFNQYIIDATSGNFFSTFVMLGIVLIFGEEILFRGLIFNELNKFLPLVVVLFTHYLIYIPLNPNLNVAIYATFNFLAYALVFVFVDSIWGSIIFQSVGAILLYSFRLTNFDVFIRKLGDGYLIPVAIISLGVLIYNILSLRKAPLKTIFKINVEVKEQVLEEA